MKGNGKGKAPNTGKMALSAYAGGDSNVARETMKGNDGFKRGGKTSKTGKTGMNAGGVMSSAHAGRMPRKSGGGVFSSASGSGDKRKPAQHY
jgi:hypothetical protein